jgi:glyoxylase-like metal-dependent hydrolase (beta-lactamase superfamily II)
MKARATALPTGKTMASISIQSFFDPATCTVTYVLTDPPSRQAAIIDSVLDYDPKSGRTSHDRADKVIQFRF